MRRGERSAVYWTLTTCVLVAAAAVGGGAWTAAHSAPPARTVVPTATATVRSTTLSSTTQLSGTLGHGASRTLFSPAGGTVTGVPAVGSTVADGGTLLSVDGLPVVLVDGAVPAWRDLSVGSAPGADVAQLEQYLVSAGFAAGLDLTVDQDYTWATATAVARWQRTVGLPATGVAARSELVFAPAPVRVVAVSAPLGSRVSDGQPALEVGSAATEVTADVPAAQTYLVHAGDRVTVTLPSGQTVPGSVAGVSTVAEAAGSGGNGGNGGGGQQGGPVTVPATVVLDDPAAAAGLDQAPVTVQVTDRTVHDVLAVPITALVALAGGGYGVYVVDRGGRQLVAVTPGLFSGTLVQVGSGALHAGDRVVIPSS